MGKSMALRRNMLYCTLQGLYCMTSCVVIAYAGVFLLERGYSNSEIGILLAVGYGLGFVLQPVVAGYTDRSRRLSLTGIIVLCCLADFLLVLVCMLLPARSWLLSGAYVLLMAADLTTLPLVNAYAAYLERQNTPVSFGVARGLGSLTYALLSVLLGNWTVHGTLAISVSGLLIFGVMAVIMAVCSRKETGTAKISARPAQSGRLTLRCLAVQYRSFFFLLLGTAVMYVGHELIANFLIQIVTAVGGGSEEMGTLLSFAAVLEVPVLCLFGVFHRKWTSEALIKFSAVLHAVRAVIFVCADSVPILYAAQALDAVSYAILLAASVSYASEQIDAANQNKAQALVTAVVTLGGILSSALGGVLLDQIGVKDALVVGLIATAAGMLLILIGMKKEIRKNLQTEKSS